MPYTRETYDGTITGRNTGVAERRNSFNFEGKTNRHASSRRSKRDSRVSDVDQNLFGDEESKDRYLITYADLITLLLGLFIILYAISNIDINKYEKMMNSIGYIFGGANVINGSKFDNNVVLTPLQKLKGELHQLIIDKNYDGSVALDENDRGITLHITDEILFPSGKAELSEDSKDVLGNLADILKKIPNDIRVEGHTDNIPIQSDLYPSNWHLSVARALNTAYFLINDKGLNPDKVSIVGYSEYQPIAPNESKIGRSKNRRVDIVIIK